MTYTPSMQHILQRSQSDDVLNRNERKREKELSALMHAKLFADDEIEEGIIIEEVSFRRYAQERARCLYDKTPIKVALISCCATISAAIIPSVIILISQFTQN